MRSVFDSLDGINTLSDDFQDLVPDIEELASLTPQLAAALAPQIQTIKTAAEAEAIANEPTEDEQIDRVFAEAEQTA